MTPMGDDEILVRLTLAASAGLAIGFERQIGGHPVGMRTHSLVALGSALFTIVGAYAFISGVIPVDPTRVAAQVVTGLGFIGAGAILRDGSGVRGVTTAATVWVSGAIGVGFGVGAYAATLGSLALGLAILVSLRRLRPAVERLGRRRLELELEYDLGHGTLGPIMNSLDDLGAQIERLRFDDDEPDADGRRRRVTVSLSTASQRANDVGSLLDAVRARPEVRHASIAPLGQGGG